MARIQDLPGELLESILQYSSLRDLLLVQRVCRQWHASIKASPRLQRQTFHGFFPAGKVEDLSPFTCDNQTSMSRMSLETKSTGSSKGSDILTKIHVEFNPVFPSEGDVIRIQTQRFREKLDSGKSWLDMYLTQPPCRSAVATLYYTRHLPCSFRAWGRRISDTAVRTSQVVRSDGVRARDVLETVRQLSLGDIKKWQRIDIQIPGAERA